MKLVKVLPILVVALLLAVPGFAQTGNLAGKVARHRWQAAERCDHRD